MVSALEFFSAPNSKVRHKHLDSSHNRPIERGLSLSGVCLGSVSGSRRGIKEISPTGPFPAEQSVFLTR